MLMVEESYALMAAEFADDVLYWESGNEIKGHQYSHKRDGGRFTFLERAQVATDLMYFASRGIKRGNRYALAVMPGLIFNDGEEGIVNFVKQIYANINSSNFPTIGKTKSKNPDDYFDLLKWHPYNWNGNSSSNSAFVRKNNAVYAQVTAGGDEGKKVLFTEFGYTTFERHT